MIKHILLAAVLSGTPVLVNAQQTVFNVPTTDVLGSGKAYAEFDAAFKFNDQTALQKFSTFVPRVVVGVGGNVEVGLNVTGNVQPGSDTTTFVPAIKWKFYENKKEDTALIAGTNFYIPGRNRSYKFGSYSYVAVSKTINRTRVTAGGYVASKNVFAANAVRGGGQFGIEQTLNNKFSVSADWITGRNSAGYFTPGIAYKPQPKVTTYFAYSIGNSLARQGNHFFVVNVGYNFNLGELQCLTSYSYF